MKKISLRSGLMATTTICGAVLSTMAGLAVVTTALAPATAEAQDYTSGAVSISVKDAGGAPVAGATVTMTSQAQGITKTLTTSGNGTATATGLAPGDYDITVSANGFDTYTGTANVVVSQEVSYTYALNTTGNTTVVVKGKRVRQDFNKTTTGLSVDLTTLTSQQAIGRSVEAVTLLAPTTVNSTAFGEPSIGGGSAAENAYYINGLNITNPDTYVGDATVPFDFYRTLDVQTSGSPAEFGRATGGVVNATTKSGTNDFMFAVHGNFAPQSLRADAFEYTNNASPLKYNKTDLDSISVEAGGAIIKDKLFLYGLGEFRDNETQFASTSGKYLEKDKNTSPFFGGKADWYITPTQHLELTYFDTTATTHQNRYAYTCPTSANPQNACNAGPTGQTGEKIDMSTAYGATTKTGGPSWVAKYSGNITDNFSVALEYGDTKYGTDFTSAHPELNYAQQYIPTHTVGGTTIAAHYENISKQYYSAATTVDDWERKFTRADFDWRFEALGKHHVRFGFDQEDLSMTKITQLPGKQPIRYYLFPDYSYGFIIYEHLGGHVSGKDSAYYIQDSWDLNSTLNLQIGWRNDDFQQSNLSGQRYLNLTGNGAPRLGLSWKPSEDSKWRFTAYYGQTYIPPAMNLGFRGKDLYFIEYFYAPAGGYPLDSSGHVVVDPTTGVPVNMGTTPYPYDSTAPCPASDSNQAPGNLGNSAGVPSCAVFGSNTQEPAFAKAAVGLKATRESEVDLGAYYRANDLWSFDLVYTHRNLDRVSEDTDFAPQINDYCSKHGMTCSYYNEYHVWNVGDKITINTFTPLPDGTKQLTLTNLGFPTPTRKYDAFTLDFKRAFDGKWGIQGSYTYAKSKGNYEGTVLSLGSGTGQTDAGSTELYDYVHLSDYSSGTLPNDRDHEFKVWGTYAITPNFTIGANVSVISPYYLSCFGHYPDSSDAAFGYGAAAHYCLDTSTQIGTYNPKKILAGDPAFPAGLSKGPHDGSLNCPNCVPLYGYKGSPMGAGGKSDWTKNIDVHLAYTLPDSWTMGGKMVLRADIFNLFNDKEVLSKNQTSDGTFYNSAETGKAMATKNTNFGTPTGYNQSRYMRVGFDLSY